MARKSKRPADYGRDRRCDVGGKRSGNATVAVYTFAKRQGFPDFAAINNAALRVLPALVEDDLTQAIIRLASEYGRYGYRRIGALLRAEWTCTAKVESYLLT